MDVAIDKSPLTSGHKMRGVGVYTRELVKALKTLKYKDIRIFDVDFEKKDLTRYDIVHYPYFHPYFLTLPYQKPTKTVVTIHDLIQLIYPKQYQSGIKGGLRFLIHKFLIKRADAIIVPSETTKKDVIRFLAIPQEKIHVVSEAPKKIFQELPKGSDKLRDIKAKYNLPHKFVLYVGDINYNKNIPGLIKACTMAHLPLVICGKQALDIETEGIDLTSLRGPRDWVRFLLGKPHPELAHYSELLSEFKKNPSVLRLGYVADGDLVAIYNLATVYVQPSFYEGFGLPILEAMACGTPVVVARTNALVEIAGNAALITDPESPEDIAKNIFKIVNDDSARLRLLREARAVVKQFSWEKTAKDTIRIYKKTLGSN